MTTQPRVSRDNYRANLAGCWARARMIAEAPIEEMIAAAERAEALGPILDPTTFRDKAAALYEELEMLRALLHVKRTMADLARRKAAR